MVQDLGLVVCLGFSYLLLFVLFEVSVQLWAGGCVGGWLVKENGLIHM